MFSLVETRFVSIIKVLMPISHYFNALASLDRELIHNADCLERKILHFSDTNFEVVIIYFCDGGGGTGMHDIVIIYVS